MDRPSMDDTAREEQKPMLRRQEDECVIIIAPVGQDAVAMAASLNAQGFETQICHGLDGYSREMIDSAGALLLTEEALESSQGSLLLNLLEGQPPGPNYRSSFSQAAANRAGQDYSIWRLRLPGL